MSIHLTSSAAEHVRKALAKRGRGHGLRFGVKDTGCSGKAYVFELIDAVAPGDQVFEDQGVKVVVDAESLSYVNGSTVDYGREGLNEGFKVTNPNIKGECGCGESFSV